MFSDRWADLRGHDLDAEARRERLEEELHRETASAHVLHGVPARAVAACGHCDDVLFSLPDSRYAVVHLSYPSEGPDRPPSPDTQILMGWDAVMAYLAAHDEW